MSDRLCDDCGVFCACDEVYRLRDDNGRLQAQLVSDIKAEEEIDRLEAENEHLRSVIDQLRATLKDVYERAVLPIDLAARVRGALEKGEWLDIADRALALKEGEMSDHHAHLRKMASVAANEDEDALLWVLTEIERLRASIAWTREVRPRKDPEGGGAIVHMTWKQFNTMRALALKEGK